MKTKGIDDRDSNGETLRTVNHCSSALLLRVLGSSRQQGNVGDPCYTKGSMSSQMKAAAEVRARPCLHGLQREKSPDNYVKMSKWVLFPATVSDTRTDAVWGGRVYGRSQFQTAVHRRGEIEAIESEQLASHIHREEQREWRQCHAPCSLLSGQSRTPSQGLLVLTGDWVFQWQWMSSKQLLYLPAWLHNSTETLFWGESRVCQADRQLKHHTKRGVRKWTAPNQLYLYILATKDYDMDYSITAFRRKVMLLEQAWF